MGLRTKTLAVAFAAFVLVAGLSASRLIANANSARTISIHNIHTKDTITVVYKKRGRYIPAAMKKINWVMRDWRRDQPTTMDPKLIDILWEVHTELGSQKPIHLISGFRSLKTNNMLRKTRGGQAKKSRHILGKAADVYFPDVPLKKLRYSGLIHQRGGVGYYPTSAIPFVHLDTSRVRHWPRMGRTELALLFPNGRTKHRPRGGGRIMSSDYWKARRKNKKLARQVAEFREFRKQPKTTAIAAATPPREEPRIALSLSLSQKPTPARRPAQTSEPRQRVASVALERTPTPTPKPRVTQGPSTTDRSRLSDLFTLAAYMPEPQLVTKPRLAKRERAPRIHQASLGGQFAIPEILPWSKKARANQERAEQMAVLTDEFDAPGSADQVNEADRLSYAGQWVPAPAYDDEHPDELSYRPFPLAPLLTASASPDDPILAQELVAPDPEATLALLTEDGVDHQMHFVQGHQAAALLWATQFSGEAINIKALEQPDETAGRIKAKAPTLARRRIKTSMR